VAWGVECGDRLLRVLLAVLDVECVAYGAPPRHDWSGGGTDRHVVDVVGVS
jgi:hypothetical protein